MEGKLKLFNFSIKRELVSSDSEPESGHERNSREVKLGRIINNKRIKREVNQSSDPESEDNESETAIPSTTQSNQSVQQENKAWPYDAMQEQQQSDDDSDVPNGSRVTVLQDIRLSPKVKTPLEKLKIMYPELKKIDTTVELELSDSDEVYFFRMPKHVNPKLLTKTEIDLETACKLNLDEKYLITPTGKVPDPKLVISTKSKVLQFGNNIIMERCPTSKKESGVGLPEMHNVSLPENVEWHPYLGSDFQQKVMLRDNIEKSLDEVLATSLKAHKKLKKKKEKTKRNEEKDDIPNQEIFDLLDSHMFLTNNDRIKKEASDDSAFGSSSSSGTLKRNKKEKGTTPDKYIKQEKELIGIETSGESNITPKRKKMKHLYHNSWSDISSINKETGVTEHIKVEGSTASSKVNQKNSSIINSTLIPDIVSTPKFKLNVSTIASEESSSGKKLKKSKKDKKRNEDGTSEKQKLISDLLNDITVKLNTSTSKKKKKKHNKHEDFDKTVKLEF